MADLEGDLFADVVDDAVLEVGISPIINPPSMLPSSSLGNDATRTERGDSFDPTTLQAPNANDFSPGRLIEELEARKLRPTGFRDQDAATLQRVLDQEFEAEKESLMRAQREKREQAAKQAGLERKRAVLERQLQEEKLEVSRDHRTQTWLSLVKQGVTPSAARIAVTSVTARALAKALWTNTSLLSLDLSRNNLDDLAGAYIARLLKRNTAMLTLELDSNRLGPQTCRAFGESLAANATLRHLGLGSNPLMQTQAAAGGAAGADGDPVDDGAHGPNGNGGSGKGSGYTDDLNGNGNGGGGTDVGGIVAMAAMLRKNCGLTSLSVWRCGLDAGAVAELAHGLEGNDTIVLLEVGHNVVGRVDQLALRRRLDENMRRLEARQQREREELAEREQDAAERRRLEAQAEKERELRQWLEDQRRERAEARWKEAEDRFAAAAAVDAKRQERREKEEAEKRATEEAKAAKAKKKKGKKK